LDFTFAHRALPLGERVGPYSTVFQYQPIGIALLVEDENAFNNITLHGLEKS